MPWFKRGPREKKTGIYNVGDRTYSRLLAGFGQLFAITPMLLVLIADWYPDLEFSSIGLIKSTACPGFQVYFGWVDTANCVEWDSYKQCGIKLTADNVNHYFGGVPPDFDQIVALRNTYSNYQAFPIAALATLGAAIISFWILVALAESYSSLYLHKPDPENPFGFMVWLFGLASIAFNIVTLVYTVDYDIALSNCKGYPDGVIQAGATALVAVSLVLTIMFFWIMIHTLRSLTQKYQEKDKESGPPELKYKIESTTLKPFVNKEIKL